MDSILQFFWDFLKSTQSKALSPFVIQDKSQQVILRKISSA